MLVRVQLLVVQLLGAHHVKRFVDRVRLGRWLRLASCQIIKRIFPWQQLESALTRRLNTSVSLVPLFLRLNLIANTGHGHRSRIDSGICQPLKALHIPLRRLNNFSACKLVSDSIALIGYLADSVRIFGSILNGYDRWVYVFSWSRVSLPRTRVQNLMPAFSFGEHHVEQLLRAELVVLALAAQDLLDGLAMRH